MGEKQMPAEKKMFKTYTTTFLSNDEASSPHYVKRFVDLKIVN
jgi:hypothetical protein